MHSLLLMLALAVQADDKTTFSTAFTVYPADCNHAGTVSGGTLLTQMDKAAGTAARLYLRQSPNVDVRGAVTIAIDKVRFLKPASTGDIVYVIAKVTKAYDKDIILRVLVEKSTESGRTVMVESEFSFRAFDLKKKETAFHQLSYP